jgi:hypothetical protein
MLTEQFAVRGQWVALQIVMRRRDVYNDVACESYGIASAHDVASCRAPQPKQALAQVVARLCFRSVRPNASRGVLPVERPVEREHRQQRGIVSLEKHVGVPVHLQQGGSKKLEVQNHAAPRRVTIG